MKGLRVLTVLGALTVSSAALPAFGAGANWESGQGLIDSCRGVSTLNKRSTVEESALVMMCLARFQSWRDAWTITDAYNTKHFAQRGPICVPSELSNKDLIERFLVWADHTMTEEMKADSATASAYRFMHSNYPCR